MLVRLCRPFALAGILAAVCATLAGAEFPVEVVCTLSTMPGNITGAAVLADYPAPGPGRVVVDFIPQPARKGVVVEPDPTTFVKVIAPDGAIAALAELKGPLARRERVELTTHGGAAGIWRIAVVGGRDGDRVAFGLPASHAWGLRGEMALGLVAETPHTAWLWIPPGRTTMLALVLGKGGVALSDAAGQDLPAKREDKGRRLLWRWTGLPAGSAVRVTLAPDTATIAFDGVPGLLCADAASAELLHGGTCDGAGLTVDGPIQARARAWMVKAAAGDLAMATAFPKAAPAAGHSPLAAVQLYGRGGPLGGLKFFMEGQVLDPADEEFGTFRSADKQRARSLHGEVRSAFEAGNLGCAVAADVDPNPAFHDKALAARAALTAFYHIVRLQGDDLIREEDLSRTNGPLIHAFFIYEGSLARGYQQLKDVLDPEAQAIWRDGLIAVGDRLADFQGAQTNQWWHVVLGHLLTHIATGEPRFLHRFERAATALLEPPPGAKFGQHPAGYFLEACGPDGHYDSLSATCLAEALHLYARLPKPDPRVLALLRAGMARDLTFSSYHWLPQPDGSLAGPSAHSARKFRAFADQPWPGNLLARDEFPLATTRWLLTPPAAHGAGTAGANNPSLVNSEAWARAALTDLVPRSGTPAFWSGDVDSPWTCGAIDAALRPAIKPAELPCRSSQGTWELPGQLAWKRGALYGLVFWDATGTPVPPDETCRTGGAPSALWSAETGVSLVSMHNANDDRTPANNNHVGKAEDLTHACVAGTWKGALWWSGRERATLAWSKPGEACCVTGTQSGSGATITWTYRLAAGTLELEVAVGGIDLAEPFLNLPFLDQAAGMRLETSGRSARFSAGSGALAMSWETGGTATATARLPALPLPVRCLRIPLERTGTGWSAKVLFSAGR